MKYRTLMLAAAMALACAPRPGGEEGIRSSKAPLALAPAMTPEIAVDDTAGVLGPGPAQRAKVAFGAGTYFAVWQDGRGGIWGTRLDATGAPLDRAGVRISATGNSPEIVFDGTHFVVVWIEAATSTTHDIRGARVSTGAVVLDATGFSIAATSADENEVALATDGSGTLVTWTRWTNSTDSSIEMGRLPANATALQATPVTLVSGSSPCCAVDHPAVGFNGSHYLIGWFGSQGLEANRLDSDLNVVGAPFPISSTMPLGIVRPKIASDGTSFLVAWTEGGGSYSGGPVIALVAGDGTVMQSERALPAPTCCLGGTNQDIALDPSIAFDGRNYLVVYGVGGGLSTITAGGPCAGARIAPDGTILDASPILACAIHAWNGASNDPIASNPPSVASDGGDFVVVWDQPPLSSMDNSVFGRSVSDAGTLGSASPISLGPNFETGPVSAFDGQNYLVVWSDTRDSFVPHIHGSRIDTTGQPVDSSAVGMSPSVYPQTDPALAFDGTNYGVVWLEQSGKYAWSNTIHWARVTPDRSVLDDIVIPGVSPDGVSAANVAFGADRYLVTWMTVQDYAVHATRVDKNATALDSIPIAVSATNTYGVDPSAPPSVGFGGTNFLVAWAACSSAPTVGLVCRIRAGRISPDGTALDLPNGFVVSPESTKATQPHVAFDGTNFVVTWRMGATALGFGPYSGDTRVVGARVTPGGSVLDPQAFAITSAGQNQHRLPTTVFDGTHFIATWADYGTDTSGDVRATRVDAQGNVLDSLSGVSVAVGSEGSTEPQLATDGLGRTLIPFVVRSGGVDRVHARLLFNLRRGLSCTSDDVCASGHCVDGVCCENDCTGECNVCSTALGASADGICTVVPADQNHVCGNDFVCDGVNAACPTSCSSDTACAGDAFCDWSGNCVPRRPQGSSCDASAGAECLVFGCRVCETGQCVDGVCCDTACSDPCEVCAASLGATADGTCSVAPAGYRAPVCAPLVCDGASRTCASRCTRDADCEADHYCTNGSCEPDGALGTACTSDAQCTSGHCADGVCCNAACDGSCVACDLQGHVGTCTPIDGSPPAGHPACKAAQGSEPCSAETCVAGRCAFVGRDVACRPASCEGDLLIAASTCDGSGVCPRVTQPCVPFACAAGACRSGTCAADADCASGYRCEQGSCVQSATCDGQHTVTLEDGGAVDCTPYSCNDNGSCRTTCNSVTDCASAYACTADGTCVISGLSAPTRDSGCSCRVGRSATGSAPGVFALALLGFAKLRRRTTRARRSGVAGLLALVLLCACNRSSGEHSPLAVVHSPLQAGSDVAVDAPVSGPAFGSQDSPVAAFDGVNYLVVWADQSGWVRGARVTSNGAVLDPLGITISDLPSFSQSFQSNVALFPPLVSLLDVAYNGAVYLVVWADGRNGGANYGGVSHIDVRGVRVNPTGKVLDKVALPIAFEIYGRPRVASDGRDFLVSWNSMMSTARLVRSDGSMSAPLTAPSSTDGTYGACDGDVAGNSGGYLWVWSSCSGSYIDRTPWGVYAQRVSSDGAVVGTPMTVALGASETRKTAVASDGTDFLVAWDESPTEYWGRTSLHYSAVTSTGPSTATALTQGLGETAPAIAYDGAHYVVTWRDGGARIDPGGNYVDSLPIQLGGVSRDEAPRGMASDGTSTLVVWADPSNPITGTDVYATRIDPSGALLDDPKRLLLSTGQNAEVSPAAAFDGQRYFVTWSDSRSSDGLTDIYGAFVSAGGSVDSTTARPITAEKHARAPHIAFDGTNYLVVWQDFRKSLSIDAIHASRVTPDGTVLDDIEVSPDAYWHDPPAVAFGTSDYLVAWHDAQGGHAARLDSTGAVLDGEIALPDSGAVAFGTDSWLVVGKTASVRVATDGTVLASVPISGSAVSFDGTNWVVIREQGGDLFARRVDSSGVVIDSRDIPVAANTGEQVEPAAVFDGVNHLITWTDHHDDVEGDLVAARLSPAGTLLDSPVSGVSLSSQRRGEFASALATDGAGHALSAFVVRDATGAVPTERVHEQLLSDLPLGAKCARGADCSSGFCSDGVCCDAACDAPCDVCTAALGASTDGRCSLATSSVTCGVNYVCGGASKTCPASCVADDGCAAGAYCSASGLCLPRKPQGKSCDDRAGSGHDCLTPACRVCETGYCADGVCCDSACRSSCDVCAAALGASADGTCSSAPAGTPGNPSCAPAKCDGTATTCPTSCTDDRDCPGDAYCDGTCKPDQPNGATCISAAQCVSGFCADGLCCDRGCWGQCEACDATGYEGVCSPISGAAHGQRAPCFTGDGTHACSAKTCDGTTDRASCVFVKDVPCHELSCSDDTQTLGAVCDGRGSCPLVTASCVPFACDGAVCKTSCVANQDCARGYRCAGGDCVEGARCDGDHVLTLPGGQAQDCIPYRCSDDGRCAERCTSGADCVAGYACSSDGTCERATAAAAPDTGCSCTAAGSPSNTGTCIALGLIALACLRRRYGHVAAS